MNIGLNGIFFLWIGFFKIFFIPMLLIPVLLIPLFFIVKKNYIYKKARFLVLSAFFSYLVVFFLSVIAVYCPVNTTTTYRYVILWLFEFSICYYIVLILFRKQLNHQIAKGLFSNKNIAIGIVVLFLVLGASSYLFEYSLSNGSFKVEGNILIVDIKKSITDTRKIISYLNRKVGSDSIILIQLDSNGGLTSEILNLSNTLFELKNRTYCYIKDGCFGGAVFIALSCDEIIMKEGSKIGKMGPIRFPETGLNGSVNKLSVETRINNEMKEKAKQFSSSKYNLHVILGMFGENDTELSKLDSSFSKISGDNPLILSSEMALKLNISRKTIKEYPDVLEFLRK